MFFNFRKPCENTKNFYKPLAFNEKVVSLRSESDNSQKRKPKNRNIWTK